MPWLTCFRIVFEDRMGFGAYCQTCYVMATREPNEHEEEDDTVNIVLHEPGAEQENERPLLSDVTPLEGLVFLMFLWRTTAHEA